MTDDFDRHLQAWMDSHESPHDAGRFDAVFASLDQRHRRIGKWAKASVSLAALAIAALALASLVQVRPPDDIASRTATPASTRTALESPVPATATLPDRSPARSPMPRATLAPVDGPLLVLAELDRRAGLTAHLELLWPRASGGIDVVEERAIDVRSRAISEGLYANLLPRPQSDQVLVNLRGFGSWVWSHGASSPNRSSRPLSCAPRANYGGRPMAGYWPAWPPGIRLVAAPRRAGPSSSGT